MWNAQGGCTLSRPKLGRFNDTDKTAPMQRGPITSRNHRDSRMICATVDGIGGSELNSLKTRVFYGCIFEMGRQAQPNPLELVGWCPGSLLTNLVGPHRRAGLTRPTSAATLLSIGSRLDPPRSYYSMRANIDLRTGPGSRRNLEAAGAIENFSRINVTTAGSILAQERYSKR